MKTVLAVGETLWDLLPGGAALGGAPCNFAYRLTELGDRALLGTRLGRDELGRRAFDRLRELGMDTSLVQWDAERPTGTVPVVVDARGVPDFTIVPDVAYDRLEATPEVLARAAEAEAVCWGTLIQRAEPARRAVERILDAAPRALKVLDANLRRDCYGPETVRRSVARADVLKLNEQEVGPVGEMLGLAAGGGVRGFARALFAATPLRWVVVTLGERGAFAASREGEARYEPGYRIRLVDTCGSGDAFTAGFVHELLRGRPLEACLRRGNALGALVAARPGATAPLDPAERPDPAAERVWDPEARRE